MQSLPGIGKELATRIVEYREANNKFSKIEDIKNINGIGDNKFEKIKDLITIKWKTLQNEEINSIIKSGEKFF